MDGPEPIAPPTPLLLLLEGQRALVEAASLLPASPMLRQAPRGDGHSVLVLPGFGAGDRSTGILRRYLERLGYSVHPWTFGRNLGPRGDLPQRLRQRVLRLHDESGRKLSLVGWSLGGIYARELARHEPERVRQVITLGSPFRGGGTASNLARLVRAITRANFPERAPEWITRLAQPPPVPSTAIFSKTDGIAAWRACMEMEAPHTDNIEVIGSHCGLGFNPAVMWILADRLAQAEGVWRPFHPGGVVGSVYERAAGLMQTA
jgi:pimeloyl-ACP methyl ester carboxylesterase